LSLRRSSFGIALYMLTVFLFPNAWWWGKELFETGIRWNLTAALILGAAVLLDGRSRSGGWSVRSRQVLLLLLLYAVNATIVHFLFANNPPRSFNGMQLLWKQVGLFVLILAALKDEFDLKVMIYSIFLGCLYIGYEIVINDRGHFSESRLMGIHLPLLNEANYLAAALCLSLPLGAWLLFFGKRWEKILALVALPLIGDVVLRCNSRAAFLSLIVAGTWVLICSRGRLRRIALAGAALAVLALPFMMKDPDIKERFMSTFVSSEERDASAQSRLDMWTQGAKMIMDYPLGSGAEAAFKSDLGLKYAREAGIYKRFAVHNGYLDIAAGWGVQGLLLYAGAIWLSWRTIRRARRSARLRSRDAATFLGICIEASLLVGLVNAVFASNLDHEYFLWFMAMGLGYAQIFSSSGREEDELVDEDDEDASAGDGPMAWDPVPGPMDEVYGGREPAGASAP